MALGKSLLFIIYINSFDVNASGMGNTFVNNNICGIENSEDGYVR